MPDGNERGVIPVLVLLVAMGLVAFLFVSNTFSFKDNFFGSLFPKPASYAASEIVVENGVIGTNENQFNYVGNWQQDSLESKSSVVNSYATISFRGTQIEYYAMKDKSYGTVAVSIDGGSEIKVNLYSNRRREGVLVWSSPVLINGVHSLKIRVGSGKGSRGSTGSIDKVVIIDGASPTPIATAVPTPIADTPSGEAMPVGDLPGWKQIFTEDFNSPAAVGQFVNVYGSKWEPYPDGWPNTFGCDGPNVRYMTSKVVSVANGVLNKYFHSEQMNDTECGKGFGTYWLSSALQPKVNGVVLNQLYGKYTVRFRSESLPTYKTAWLLWPQSEVWPRDGEIDFPEGGLDGNICAFMHRQNGVDGGDQDAFCTNTTFSNWHTASIEWHPTQTKFILDGVVIGTSTSRIPNTPMRWVLQSEGCWGGCPPAGASANLQIDWAVIYSKI